MIKGVDVSHWQGDIDFEALKRQGYEFAIIKATQGTWFVDEKLEQNVARCEAAGMAHSLYHFLDPIQDEIEGVDDYTQTANEQLNYFLENTKGLHGQLPNALDVEWQGSLSNNQLTALVLDFLQSTILRWLLYSNLNFLDNIIKRPDEVAQEADIWLAWPSGFTPPKLPQYYDEELVKLWQWDWSDNLDKNRVLDPVWYYSHVPPQIYAVVKVVVTVPPGITVDTQVIYE